MGLVAVDPFLQFDIPFSGSTEIMVHVKIVSMPGFEFHEPPGVKKSIIVKREGMCNNEVTMCHTCDCTVFFLCHHTCMFKRFVHVQQILT